MITAMITLSIVFVLLFALMLWIGWYSDVYYLGLSSRDIATIDVAQAIIGLLAACSVCALLGVVLVYIKQLHG